MDREKFLNYLQAEINMYNTMGPEFEGHAKGLVQVRVQIQKGKFDTAAISINADLLGVTQALLKAHKRRGAALTSACGDNDAVVLAHKVMAKINET